MGFYGPTTENALNQLAGLLNSGVIPRGFDDINPLRLHILPHHEHPPCVIVNTHTAPS